MSDENIRESFRDMYEVFKEITGIHQPQDVFTGEARCSGCKKIYPCPTMTAIYGWEDAFKSERLFKFPEEIEGAGTWIEEIIRSLNIWMNDPEHPMQEHELLTDLYNFTKTYLERSND